MLFGGKGRIADVLPFGNLRHVVGLGRVGGGADREGLVEQEVATEEGGVKVQASEMADVAMQKQEMRNREVERLMRRNMRKEEKAGKAAKEWPSGEAKVTSKVNPSVSGQVSSSRVPGPQLSITAGARSVTNRSPAAEKQHGGSVKGVEQDEDEDNDFETVPKKQEVRTKLGEGRVLSFKELMGGASNEEQRK